MEDKTEGISQKVEQKDKDIILKIRNWEGWYRKSTMQIIDVSEKGEKCREEEIVEEIIWKNSPNQSVCFQFKRNPPCSTTMHEQKHIPKY